VASPRTSNAVLFDHRPGSERSGAPAVALNGLTRVFGAVPGVVRVNLSVDAGEIVLIRGPNGAGKTTLLRLIATAISPTYGTGQVLGFDLATERDEIRRRIELVGHRTRLYEDLTAAENIRFACALHSLDHSRVEAALERVGLSDVDRDRVRGFSQGMRQRVALARLLLRSPELVLLDEPYAGLDDDGKGLVDVMIEEVRADGRTVILATHDPTRGGTASRTVFMDQGRLVPSRATIRGPR
jgi:heme exporter protein A